MVPRTSTVAPESGTQVLCKILTAAVREGLVRPLVQSRGSLETQERIPSRTILIMRSLLAMSTTATSHTPCFASQSVKPTQRGALYPGKSTSLPRSLGIMELLEGFGYQVPMGPDHRPKGLGGHFTSQQLEILALTHRDAGTMKAMDYFNNIQTTCKVTAQITPVFTLKSFITS